MDSKYKQRLVRLLELLKEAPPAQDDEFADEEPANVAPPVKKKVAVPGNTPPTNVPRNAPVNKAPANVPPANAAPTNAPANVPTNAPTNVPANAAPANAPANAPTNAPVNAQPKIPANMASNAAPSANVPTNTPAANVPVAIPGMDNDVPANANAVSADAEEKVRQGKVNLFFDKLAENPNLMSFLQLTNPLEQAAAIERFAELVGIPQGQLVNVLNSLRQKASAPTPEPAMESKVRRGMVIEVRDKIRKISKEDADKFHITRYPRFSVFDNVLEMRRKFGENAKLVVSGNYIYDVSKAPSIYDAASPVIPSDTKLPESKRARVEAKVRRLIGMLKEESGSADRAALENAYKALQDLFERWDSFKQFTNARYWGFSPEDEKLLYKVMDILGENIAKFERMGESVNRKRVLNMSAPLKEAGYGAGHGGNNRKIQLMYRDSNGDYHYIASTNASKTLKQAVDRLRDRMMTDTSYQPLIKKIERETGETFNPKNVRASFDE